jgi:hypothetical protein
MRLFPPDAGVRAAAEAGWAAGDGTSGFVKFASCSVAEGEDSVAAGAAAVPPAAIAPVDGRSVATGVPAIVGAADA